MISKKQLAAFAAALLTAVAGTLYKCQDTAPVVPSVPVLGAADAGVP